MTSHPPDDVLLERALAAARAGRALDMRRDLSGALERYREAEHLLTGMDATPLLANLLRWEGSVFRDKGDIDRADELYEESLRIAEECGSLTARASAANCRAVIAQRRGDIDEAVRLYRSASRLATEAGEIRLTGMIQQNLGILENVRGDLEGAQTHYKAALRAFEEVNDDPAMSWVLNNLGMLFNDLSMHSAAEKAFMRALGIARARGDRPLEGVLLTNYAEGLIAVRRWDDARETLEEAFAIVCEGDEPGRAGEVLKFYGVLERERGRLDEAAARFEQALNVSRSVHDRLLVAEVLLERGDLHMRRGDREAALRDWTESLSAFARVGATRDAAAAQRRLDDLGSASSG